jgi:hypothetical protein
VRVDSFVFHPEGLRFLCCGVFVLLCVALLYFPFPHSLVRGGLVPRDLQTAYCRGRRISVVVVDWPRASYRFISFVVLRPHTTLGWMAYSRESNKIKINRGCAIVGVALILVR